MMTIRFGIVCLCLAIGAVALNGESVKESDPINESSDYTCDQNGYLQYLSKWSVEEKSTSRDVNSEEFKRRLEYSIESCEKIHEWNKKNRYQMEFTFYADWHVDEFEELTTTKQRYSGVITPVPSIVPIYNNTNYRHLMPSMDPCDGNAELRVTVSKPQNCSVSWAFAVTNSIEYAIKKMYLEEYGQSIEVSLSAQELIDCVGKEHGVNGKVCDGMPLVWGFDYIYENGIAYSEFYPHTNVEGECVKIEDSKKYHIAGYEKPAAYNKLGLFDLMMRGPVAVTLGLDPEYFQFYRNDRAEGPYFNTAFWRPTVNGVLVEYSQYAANGDSTVASNPFFAVETRLRGCDSMVFRLPILDTIEDANMGGIAGFAIRPIVVELIPVKPTSKPIAPTTSAPTMQPTITPTILPTTVSPTVQPPTETPSTLILHSCSQLDSLPSQLLSITHLIIAADFDCEGSIDLRRFVNCEMIEVESDAMRNVTSVDIRGLESLESIEIGDDSCDSLSEVIVGDTSFSVLTNVTIGSNSLNSLPTLPPFHAVQSLIVGSNSLTSVSELELNESMQLATIKIGEGSLIGVESLIFGNSTDGSRRLWDRRRGRGLEKFGLTHHETGYSFSMNEKSVLRNVKKIEVRENCFHSINRFEVRGLIRLERIVIGSNSIIGSGETSVLMIEECSSLQWLTVGDGSLKEYGEMRIRKNGMMVGLELGAWSFNKAQSVEMIGSIGWFV